MIDSLLAAIDTSEHGPRVSDYALFVARVFGCRVHALSVLETKKIEGPLLRDFLSTIGLEPGLDYAQKVERFLEMKARDSLVAFEERCRSAGVPCTIETAKGVAGKLILERGSSTDLILIGQRGEHAEWHGDALGGSVESVIRASPRPILVVPRRYHEIRRALLAYDGSRHAREALELAKELADRTRLLLTVLAVRSTGDGEDGTRREVEQLLGPHTPHELRVATGEPYRAILEAAESLDCQLIVMGAYGHSRIRELIIGSTTVQVLRRSKLPILLSR